LELDLPSPRVEEAELGIVHPRNLGSHRRCDCTAIAIYLGWDADDVEAAVAEGEALDAARLAKARIRREVVRKVPEPWTRKMNVVSVDKSGREFSHGARWNQSRPPREAARAWFSRY